MPLRCDNRSMIGLLGMRLERLKRPGILLGVVLVAWLLALDTAKAQAAVGIVAAIPDARPVAALLSSATAEQTVTVDSGTIPLAVTVPMTGAFTLTVDPADTVALTVHGSVATAVTAPIEVSDTRNNFPGWSVSGQDANWTGSGAAAGATISGDQLGWTPTSSTSPLTPGVTLGPAVTPARSGLGTAPAVLASARSGLGNGAGTTTLGATLTLAIPWEAPAGPYTSSLTVTAVDMHM